MTEEIINLKDYFTHHYDDWGRLYCVEFKEDPLELENSIKCLEQENKELRQQYNCYACDTCQGKEDYRNMKRHCENAIKTVHTYRSALEEIRILATKNVSIENFVKIQNKINEVINDTKTN